MDQHKNYFPKNFYWGGSTCSYQVEGGNVNQWSVWELEHASELAKTAEKRLGWVPAWDHVKHKAESPANYICGRGIEHIKRYSEDFSLARELNLNAFRFGIEWSRVEPEEGVWNKKAWDHYKAYVAEMRRSGLEPFLNIWHWTVPVWFAEKGGFTKRSNLKYWDRYVAKICEELDLEHVRHILTINEPNVYASFSYMTGEWVPQHKNPLEFVKVYYNLVRAHRRAYRIIKDKYPNIKIGIAHQMANIQSKRPHNLIDVVTTKWMRYSWNWWFLRRIRRSQDFVGINYYFSDYYKGFWRANPKTPLNDLGWYMEPEGLYPLVLRAWARFKKPIYITENGVADMRDEYRQWWLQETMIALNRALSEGIDVAGYFHWSLLDNFEWKYGWWPEFGLVHVDRKTMKRTIRPSALWWAKEIAASREK
jgi:beta-glucosidase